MQRPRFKRERYGVILFHVKAYSDGTIVNVILLRYRISLQGIIFHTSVVVTYTISRERINIINRGCILQSNHETGPKQYHIIIARICESTSSRPYDKARRVSFISESRGQFDAFKSPSSGRSSTKKIILAEIATPAGSHCARGLR